MEELLNPSTGQPYQAKNEYAYSVSIAAALVNTASTSASFNVDGDSDFFWTKLTAFAMVGGPDGTVISLEEYPAVSVVITNTTTGRAYMNQPVALPSISGSGRLPFILPMVTYFQNKSTISVDIAGLSTGKTYSFLQISFIGIKAFF